MGGADILSKFSVLSPASLCPTSMDKVKKHDKSTFSGFSVGFCINEEEGYLLPTVARKIICRRFD